jgi:hypothetical protein
LFADGIAENACELIILTPGHNNPDALKLPELFQPTENARLDILFS